MGAFQGNTPYSVLMSTYEGDKPEYLDAAIDSMVEQSLPFHDMVIVCDGPLTEGLEDCLASWKARLGDRLSVSQIHKNVGLGSALAVGLPLCGCGIVARMDADDLSRSYRCELLLAAMQRRNLDLVGGAIEEFDTVPGDMGVVRVPPLDSEEISRYASRRNPFNHMSVMFRRDAVVSAGGYQPFRYMEDYWLWVRMLAGGAAVANIADVVIDARAGNGMYARRANAAYLRSQRLFFSRLSEMGFVTRGQAALAITERSIAALMPPKLLKLAYNAFLRERAVNVEH